MSQIKGRNTKPEKLIRSELRKLGLKFKTYPKDLPGKPDIVFRREKVVVFVDGDFWHGFRFSRWEHTVSEFWKVKILRNRSRDQRNFRMLRRRKWKVIRFWQHAIEANIGRCVLRVSQALANSRSETGKRSKAYGSPNTKTARQAVKRYIPTKNQGAD